MRYFHLIISFIVGLIFSILSALPVSAQTTWSCANHTFTMPGTDRPICSATWTLTGAADGTDQVQKWSVSAVWRTGFIWSLTPWEPFPVTVVGFSLIKTQGGPHTNTYVGSNCNPDVIGWLLPGATGAQYSPSGWAAGFGFPLPSSTDPTAPGCYLDLHSVATGGGTLQYALTVYYAPQPSSSGVPVCTTMNPSDKSANLTLSGGNLSVSNNGVATHSMVRAVAGIVPNTGQYHWEWTFANQGNTANGPPINIVGIQDGAVAVSNAVGNAGTGAGIGYNSGNGWTYADGFTPIGASGSVMANGTYAADYDSALGQLTITGPNMFTSITRTVSSTIPTLYPAVSLWGSGAGTITFNFGASAFSYPVPTGYKSGLCQ